MEQSAEKGIQLKRNTKETIIFLIKNNKKREVLLVQEIQLRQIKPN